ncbi:M1 family metallopeptidase [Actinorhabdospora filicis]|uniref:M1 family metallopeptidase n=1 Tax=Actinorhabdospora filicis TaxID=1785913 RepID=UPI00255715A6|nr:M1 family metallopeptidase [Actinorhabdospora filicis]
MLAVFGVLAGCGTAVLRPPLGIPVPADLGPGRSDPVADPLYPDYGTADVDVLHYGLALDYDPDTTVLSGLATITLRPTRDLAELRLDFAATLAVSRATVDGRAAAVRQADGDIVIATPAVKDATVTLAVAYSGVPRPVTAPASRADSLGDGLGLRAEPDGSLWTMQEPYGAFTWYPVNDHPSDEALYDITVSVPRGYAGVASGRFAGEREVGDSTVFTWRSADPVASYLTTLAVDRFERMTLTGPRGLPVTVWLPTGTGRVLRRVTARIPEYLAFLEERYGPYPFDSAGVVVTGGDSAMETQQMITFSADLGRDEKYAADTLVHELAHQWFGDAVTPTDWRAVWLSEGMATYADGMWIVEQGWSTEDELIGRWRGLDQDLRDEAGPPGAYDPGQFASGNVYTCVALLLHEIRERVGEAPFAAMMRDWVQAQKNTHQDRASFTAWVNAHAGADLTALIDAWLDSPATPT